MTRQKIEDSVLKDTSDTILVRMEIKNIIKSNNLNFWVVYHFEISNY